MTTSSGTGEEFRESTRAPLETPVTLQIDTFSEPQSGYTANVSVGGMFVNLSDPQPVGTIVRFEVELGGGDSTIRGVAEVAWIRAHAQGPELPAGMGLQFRLIEEDGQERLRAVVKKILDARGDPDVVQPPKRSPAPLRVEPPRAAQAPQPSPSTSKPERTKILAALVLFAVLLLLLLRSCG